jgi:hypothetical protein
VGQDRVKDVDVDRVKVEDVDVGMVKVEDVDRVKVEDGEREIQTDDFPRSRDYNEYMGNNNKAIVKKLSEYRELGSGRSVHMSRDRNSRVYC